jgi:hypothetical protein
MKKDLFFNKSNKVSERWNWKMVRWEMGMMLMMMILGQEALGLTRYSVATGDWNSNNTWAATSGGTPGVSFPVAGDIVYIENGYTVTVTADAACTTLNFAQTSGNKSSGNLIINSNCTLAVSGTMIVNPRENNAVSGTISGEGTLTCGTFTVGSTSGTINVDATTILTTTLSTITVSGNINLISDVSGGYTNNPYLYFQSGTISASSVTTSHASSGGNTAIFSMATGNQTGTLKLSSTTPWTLDADGTNTITLSGTGTTVEYNATGNQTVLVKTYTNLILAGSGIKTLTSSSTVNGTLSIQGTATSSGAPTYGVNSSLEYKGLSAQTTGAEWPGSFSKPVIIANTNGVVTCGTATFTGTSATTTINAGATLATGAGTFTAAGPMAINGAFQINQGGYANGAVAWTYGSNGTLIYNNSTGPYGAIDNNHLYWPSTNGPVNVTVQNGGGINMGVARTVNGTFLLVSGTNAVQGTALTLNGTTQINGGNFQTTPTYGSSSTLVYNTSYGTSNEWTGGASNTVAAGSGIPANVTIQSGMLTLGGGRGVPGNVTVQSGAGLVLNATSGDLYIGGNLSNSGSTWTNNSRAVFFVKDNTQTITASSGIQYFDYLVLDKTGGSVQLTSTNVTINTYTGSVLQLLNSGGLDLNGRTLTLNNSGGNILVNGGARAISSTVAGGKIEFNQYKTISGSGTLAIGSNVTVNLNANGNVNFGSGVSTINGTLSINSASSCYVNTNAPSFGNGSSLIYNSGTSYGRGLEWSATSGAGYPYHVQISNNTTVDMGANSGTGTARQCAGNLTVDAGSTFSMNVTPMTAAVTVIGNIVNNGTITLSGSIGGDLKTQGNINDNGTFNANSRAIFFNGGNTQVIQGTGVFDISYVRINKSAGSVQLATNLTCEGPGGRNAMEVDGASSVLDLNGFTLYLGKAGVESTYNSGIATPGVIKGSSTSNISILGTGALGTINFDQTTPGTTNALQNLTINRTSTGTVTLGNSLAVNGTLTLTDGTISGTLSYGANGILIYNGTSYTNTTDVEFPASGGPKTLTITTANATGLTLHATRTLAGDLTIGSGQKFIIPDDKDLTVDGATVTNNGLYLKSPATGYGRTASFWPKGTTSGDVNVERSIPGWTSNTDGWNFLAAPVSNQNIAPNFTISNPDEAKYDFYRWVETDVTTPWHNYKAGGFTTFTPGEGYLVAFDDDAVKNFSGAFNNSDITLTNQSYTTASAYHGWHLLGNPFTCAVNWNNGDWDLSGVDAVAKVMNSGSTYTDISAGSPIPALNGFLVHVASGTNALTIPRSARTHSTTNWYKNTDADAGRLMLTAQSNGNNTYVEAIIQLEQNATPAFDSDFDSYFLRGIAEAPQLFSISPENEKLSLNALPQNQDTRDITLGFVKGIAGEYTLTISGLESFCPGVSIHLEDVKTGQNQDLRQNPSYNFTAADGDNSNRFILHFGGTYSTNDLSNNGHINIFTSGNQIFISGLTNGQTTGNVLVYNLMGQQIAAGTLDQSSKCRLNLDVPTGYYLVKVVTPEITKTSKVFIN